MTSTIDHARFNAIKRTLYKRYDDLSNAQLERLKSTSFASYVNNKKLDHSLAAAYPDIAKDWHPTKNGDLTPCDIASGSCKKVWWICDKGHEWQSAISSRTLQHTGCPYCVNRKVLKGFNDLATTHPDIAKEWHPIKNGDLTPYDVVAGSNKKAWWLCSKGHEWQSIINSRALYDIGCPYCANRKVLKGFNDLATTHPNIAKEWHPVKNGDLTPYDVIAGSGKKVWWMCSKGHEWQITPECRALRHAGCPYCSNKKVSAGFNDLATTHPDIAKEWHPIKNGDLTPYDVVAGSNKKVWWMCSKGHEWQTIINHRALYDSDCPCCLNQKVSVGFNDLATICPDIAKEWHPVKNGDLTPCDVVSGSCKKVWWMCSKGHEWQAVIEHRVSRHDRCPYCSNKQALKGFNDLATVCTDIAKEWHPTKNDDLTPYDVMIGSRKKVWWLCSKGHEWQATINNRALRHAGCPYCANRKVLKGFNDLAITHPDIAKEWHPTKNGDLTPCDVVAGSSKKVWWMCNKGHEWQAIINSRTLQHAGCTYCANQKILKGFNDLATVCPDIAKEWHPTKNGDLAPCDVMYGSGKRVWWMCDKGHEWQSAIGHRVSRHSGCPRCSHYKACKDQ